MKSIAKTKQWLTLAIALLLALAGGSWLTWKNWARNPIDATSVPKTDPRLPTSPVSRPVPPPEGYVGSASCEECHGDLCKSFAQHPMGRSSAQTPWPADLEEFSEKNAQFSALDGTRYKAEKIGNMVLHHEIGTDDQGRKLYDLALPVNLAIGSGTRGKTYGINRDGILLQSPISWYSAKGGYFELSPGYENVTVNPRFGRRMTEQCLVCHVGRMAFDPEIPDKLVPPYFHEIAIGCERCHGPGEKHVAAQQLNKSSSPDPTIVNPARLPMRERESVCNQCHLHGEHRESRYGRRPRDFRPGMDLEEITCFFVKDDATNSDLKAVSQVEQMHASACFRGNPEKLGCISCHNPHEWPEPQKRDAYYRTRCNVCHADRGCSLDANSRAGKGDSCIACHMPRTSPKDVVHASQTDHRVPKNPLKSTESKPQSEIPLSSQRLKVFDEGERRLPHWEVQRARGIMIASSEGSGESRRALAQLISLAKVVPDDIPLLSAIGTAYLNQKDYSHAREWLERAVAIEPKNSKLHGMLALSCWGADELATAKEHIAEVVKLDPFSASGFELQAKILEAAGEHEQALRAVDKVIELDPSKMAFREKLLKP